MTAVSIALCQTDLPTSDLVAKAAANHVARAMIAANFNYTERVQNINFDAKGKESSRHSDTYDVVFVEGAPYRIHIAHNDRPLSSSDKKTETDKMAETASARKAGDRRTSEKSGNVKLKLPIAQLASQFDLASQGTEEVSGLSCARIQATPKRGFQPLNDEEILANAITFELWIDPHDQQIVKVEAKFTSSAARFRAGTVVIQEFTKINHEVWLPKQMSFRGPVQSGRKDVTVESEQTYSNFKKFRVE